MKLGLILECPREGTDHQVYEYVISQLNSKLKIEVIPTGAKNKPEMIRQCGLIAKTLLDTSKCDKIAIIWDLMPVWGEEACRKEDIKAIIESLTASGVDLDKVKLICIEPELEAWLIVEGKALTAYKESLIHPHPCPKFNGKKVHKNSNESKAVISKYLERKYNDMIEAIKIAKHITSFDKVAKKHESFERFSKFIKECT